MEVSQWEGSGVLAYDSDYEEPDESSELVIEPPPVLLTPLERINQLKAQIAAEEGQLGKRKQLPPLEILDVEYVERKERLRKDAEQQAERRAWLMDHQARFISETEIKRVIIQERNQKAAKTRLERNYRDKPLTNAEKQRRKREAKREKNPRLAGKTKEQLKEEYAEREKARLKGANAARARQRSKETEAEANSRKAARNEKDRDRRATKAGLQKKGGKLS